ncbi:MAG: AraC family transcriptional regulator [Verrucomicrobiota bacterium]
MENIVKYLEPIPRKFPSPLPTTAIGLVHKATSDRVQQSFPSYNFSLILSGSGNYRCKGKLNPVQSPCVITQWPEEPMDYGPKDNWTELYIIYDRSSLPELRKRNLHPTENIPWPIAHPQRIAQQAEHIVSLLRNWDDSQIDYLDRLCELIIISTLTPDAKQSVPANSNRIDQARQWLEDHYNENISIDSIADRFGFSSITFRRHWTKRVGSPPAQFLTRLRMQRARQLLVETDNPVSTISRQVGYDDPLYFSRRFRQEIKTTPTQYRINNRSTLNL